jgi:hypothetical protein
VYMTEVLRRNRLTSIRLFPAEYVTLFTTTYESNHYVPSDLINKHSDTEDELYCPYTNNPNNSVDLARLTSKAVCSVNPDINKTTSQTTGVVHAIYSVYETVGKSCIIL